MYKYATGYLKEPLYRNSLYLMLTTIIGTGSGFFFWIIAAKFYSPEDVGISVAIISAIGLLSLFTRFGLEIGIIGYLPKEKDKGSLINSCLVIISLSSVVVAIIFLLGIGVFSPKLEFLRKDTFLMLSFIICTVFFSLYTFQYNVFIALRDTKYSLLQSTVAISRILALPALTLIGFLGIYISNGIGFIISVTCGNLFISKMIPDYKLRSLKRNSVLKEMIQFSLGNYIATIFEATPNYLYPLLVVNFLKPEMNAYFYIAWSLSTILFMIPKATSTSLFAEGLYSFEELSANSRKALKLTTILLIPSILIIFVSGAQILSLFGHDYSQNAFEMLKLLAISAVPYSFNMLFVSIKRVQKHMGSVVYVYAGLTICSFILSFILIKEMGLTGIGYGWLIANIIINIIIAIQMMKSLVLKKSYFVENL